MNQKDESIRNSRVQMQLRRRPMAMKSLQGAFLDMPEDHIGGLNVLVKTNFGCTSGLRLELWLSNAVLACAYVLRQYVPLLTMCSSVNDRDSPYLASPALSAMTSPISMCPSPSGPKHSSWNQSRVRYGSSHLLAISQILSDRR